MYHITKRLFDIICSFIGCLFLIPIAIILKIAFMLTGDFKSIFYSQDRIGKNGKYFKFYKFRSMVPNADEVLQEILRTDKELAKEYRRMKKFHDDPRITKVGRFIRRTSIDELPQLINVLKGDELKTKVVPLQEHWNPFAKPFDGDCVRKLIDLKEGTTKILDKQFIEGVVYEDTIWDDPKDEEDWKKRHPEGPVKL